MPMTGAERVAKHRARLYAEREAQIRATWTPGKLPPADLDRLRDWLAKASPDAVAAFLAPVRSGAPLHSDVTPPPCEHCEAAKAEIVKLKAREEVLVARERFVDRGLMTERQYRVLKAAVHPDRAGDGNKDHYRELFHTLETLKIVFCMTPEEEQALAGSKARQADMSKRFAEAFARRQADLAERERAKAAKQKGKEAYQRRKAKGFPA